MLRLLAAFQFSDRFSCWHLRKRWKVQHLTTVTTAMTPLHPSHHAIGTMTTFWVLICPSSSTSCSSSVFLATGWFWSSSIGEQCKKNYKLKWKQYGACCKIFFKRICLSFSFAVWSIECMHGPHSNISYNDSFISRVVKRIQKSYFSK